MTGLFALLIEDEQVVRLATAQTLELGGFTVQACANAELAQQHIKPEYAGIIVTDVRLPGKSGLDVLDKVRAIDSELPVIIITGHGDIGMAVEAMRRGAYDFLEKPFAADRLLEACLRAQEKRRLIMENRRLKLSWLSHSTTPDLVGQSPQIERVRKFIQSIGPSQADVLINGATGSGKEVVARHLHLASGRKGEFVAINCGALPESVFESEIFGHEAGAYTGAQKRRIGKLEYAHGGTVFLDEIESMPLNLQVKLLRVLQERSLERLGGNQAIALDCRIVAASKADLIKLSALGQFREDLYYRLSVVSIHLPSLNERRDDIPLLLSHFVQRAGLRYQKEAPVWSAAQMQRWMQADWPGNVRELRNFADQLVLGVAESSDHYTSQYEENETRSDVSLPEKIDAYEANLIHLAMEKSDNNVAAAAELLGIPRKTLYDKIKKYQKTLSAINQLSEQHKS